MKTVELNKLDRSKLHTLTPDSSNNESYLYVYDGDTLIKHLYHPSKDKRRRTVSFLGEYENDRCVLPKEECVDSRGCFAGYTMDYLKEYKVIRKVITDPTIPFERRMKIAKEVCSIIRSLEKDKIAYYDVHSENLLINDSDDIKLIDMDSATIKKIKGEEAFSTDIRFSHYHSAMISMATLYGMDDVDFKSIVYMVNSIIAKRSNDEQKKIFSYLRQSSGRTFYIEDYLDSITPEYIEDTKKYFELALK